MSALTSEPPGRAPGGSAELLWLGAGGGASKKKFTACALSRAWVPAPSQIGGLLPLSRAKTPYLPTYCGRQPPGSVPHLPTYCGAAQRSEKYPLEPVPGAFAGAAVPGAATAGAAAAPVSAGVPAAGDSPGMAPFAASASPARAKRFAVGRGLVLVLAASAPTCSRAGHASSRAIA